MQTTQDLNKKAKRVPIQSTKNHPSTSSSSSTSSIDEVRLQLLTRLAESLQEDQQDWSDPSAKDDVLRLITGIVKKDHRGLGDERSPDKVLKG